jgi:hypothetical protein
MNKIILLVRHTKLLHLLFSWVKQHPRPEENAQQNERVGNKEAIDHCEADGII